MFWPPNVEGVLWFARQVLPLIHQTQPDARFAIVGKNPPPQVQALAADPRIEVTGYLSDPLPYLSAAAAFVVPLFAGSGMRVKILDAWLWGIPIVTTSLGAEGIAVRPGENILLADDPAQFAAAVLSLLHHPVLNQRLRSQGRPGSRPITAPKPSTPRSTPSTTACFPPHPRLNQSTVISNQ